MSDGLALPIICKAKTCAFALHFASLKILFHHPYLMAEEKTLWMWLATTYANNVLFSCSLSYEQISCAVNKPIHLIHRVLLRLRIMGFLEAHIPLWYGKQISDAIAKEVRTLTCILPSQTTVKNVNKMEFLC